MSDIRISSKDHTMDCDKLIICQVLDGTWVHDMCQGSPVGCKVVNGSHSGFRGALAKSKRQ